MSAKILIVDDEESILNSLSGPLEREGYEIITCENAAKAKKENGRDVDLSLLDVWLPDGDGIELLEQFKKLYPLQRFIMMSGHSDIETAVKAVKMGAHDFLEKPLSLDRVLISIENALELRRLAKENLSFKRENARKYEFVGESDEIEELKILIDRIAKTDSRVLIRGENGTGKEIVARNIFFRSNRADKPFVTVNCAALPDELIESELFGFQKGAFTGATFARGGRFEDADGGTIFLDEIGDMSAKTQAKLLRVLEEGEVERLGGGKLKKIDVRVIAATNRNLEKKIEEGKFREDLYFRLNVVPIYVPPLRQHKDDIPILAEYFVNRLCEDYGHKRVKIAKPALNALVKYNYPGNVRELRNIIERLLVTGDFSNISKEDVDFVLSTASLKGRQVELKTAVEEFERSFILARIKETNGNMAEAARRLGLERSHLYKKMKGLGLEVKER
ncbi:MAG: response regulator [candidate division Zixibacteria bacterium]|nr:response regulator [candidate division Zixibacteria bacterium]